MFAYVYNKTEYIPLCIPNAIPFQMGGVTFCGTPSVLFKDDPPPPVTFAYFE